MAVLEHARYQEVQPIGAGAMGRVSLVRDLVTGELLALKRLHESVAAQGGARLRREFKSLERIDHECVVKVHGFGDEDGVPFIVMEYVRGQDLAEFLNTKPSQDALVRVFQDVALALGAVHASGVVHRDLKPENIRVTPEGRAKLMDFGLAKSLEGTVALTRAGAVVGTVLYMSPEQCRGAALDYRADLYALGAVMYWAFAGRTPFTGEGLAQVVVQHLQTPPTPPRQFNPELSGQLEALILSLLAKAPGDRPASAMAVFEALSMALAGPMPALTPDPAARPQPRADALLLAPLVGRDAELNTLLSLLRDPAARGVYAVTGDVGSGKTRLLRAFADEARAGSDVRLAFGEAVPDDPTPFGAVSRLIAALERTHAGVLEGLSPGARGELARIAPTVFTDAPAPEANLPPEVARLRLFEAATELLERASLHTVLVVENLHWADESTLALLAHATRALGDALRLVVSYRLEDLPAGQTVPRGLSKPKVTLALTPLSVDSQRALLDAWLDGEIDPVLENELVQHASGNPWVLEERLRAMLESGAVYRKQGVYAWNHAALALPESLNDLLAHRIGALDPHALEFARAASVLGKVWLYSDARALLEWDDDQALEALEALTRARLVQEVPGTGGEGFRFTHPLYTEMLLGGLMLLKRRRLHGKAARLLEGRSAAPLELAQHYFFARDFAASLHHALAAGRAAQAAFAYPQAERAYRLALEASAGLSAPVLETWQVKHALAEILSYTGRNDEAITVWEEVLKYAPALEGGASLVREARVKLARVQRFVGALSASRSLLGELDPDDPFFEDLKLELSLASRDAHDFAEARRYGLEALSASRRSANLSGQVRSLAALSSLCAATGQARRALWLAQVAVQVAEASEDAFLKTEAWNELGRRHLDLSQGDEALRAWERAAEYARTTLDLRSRAGLEINIAAKLMGDADYWSAAERLREARKLAARAGLVPYEQVALYNLGCCEYAVGNLNAARECFHDVKLGPSAQDARVAETRITLELGDGFVYELPALEDADTHLELLEVQWALSFGDYQKAWTLTERGNADYPWMWAVCRIHAGWRLGRDTRFLFQMLGALNPEDDQLAVSSDSGARFVAFLKRATARRGEDTAQLRHAAQDLRASSLGLLARDVLLTLSSS
jgi:tetratricopeptide (TPR) repeat protein